MAVALQIRDVPEEVRDVLAERARERGVSLQVYLLELVKQDAVALRNAKLVKRFMGRSDGTTLDRFEVQRAIDEAKAERDA